MVDVATAGPAVPARQAQTPCEHPVDHRDAADDHRVVLGVLRLHHLHHHLVVHRLRDVPPGFHFVGFAQYQRLWSTDLWLIAVNNIWLFGILSLVVNLVAGFLLAVFMDQNIKQESLFRLDFPLSVRHVADRHPASLGNGSSIRASGCRRAGAQLGLDRFRPGAAGAHQETAIYGLVVAGIWQGSGVTMAIMLAGLRGVDQEVWKAAKIDGIPTWRTYLFIVLPMMRGAVATRLHPAADRHRPRFRPGLRHDPRRPRQLHLHAGHVCHQLHHRAAQCRAGHGGGDHDAGAHRHSADHPGPSSSGGTKAGQGSTHDNQ